MLDAAQHLLSVLSGLKHGSEQHCWARRAGKSVSPGLAKPFPIIKAVNLVSEIQKPARFSALLYDM